jgi:hypothetical protein
LTTSSLLKKAVALSSIASSTSKKRESLMVTIEVK